MFLVTKAFQTHLQNKRVPVAFRHHDSKKVGTHSLDVRLMVLRLMTFCYHGATLPRAPHIQGCLNVISDSLSCRVNIIKTSLKHKTGFKEFAVTPSSVFLTKNQFDGPDIVQPVVIATLKPTLDHIV